MSSAAADKLAKQMLARHTEQAIAERDLFRRLFGTTPDDFLKATKLMLSVGRSPTYGLTLEEVEQAKKCAEMIASYGSSGSSVGASLGSAVPGVGTAIGAAAGFIAGAIVAAWECGALSWLREAVEAIAAWFEELFNPKPEEFQVYIDVGGPAVRRGNFTMGPEKEERLFLGGFSLGAAGEKLRKQMNARLPGTKVSRIESLWLLRRTMELGGGAEEFAALNRVLFNTALPTKRDRTYYDRVTATFQTKGLPASFAKFKKAIQFDALRRGGFTSAEAHEEVYGSLKTKANAFTRTRYQAELAALRALLDKYKPGPEELAERTDILKRSANIQTPNWQAALGQLPEDVKLRLDVRKLTTGASGTPFTRIAPEESGSALPLILLVAAGAFLLLRKR